MPTMRIENEKYKMNNNVEIYLNAKYSEFLALRTSNSDNSEFLAFRTPHS